MVGVIRGRGLLAGVRLVESRAPRRVFAPERRIGPAVAQAAERNGLFVRAIGDTIALCPPLIIDEGEIAMLIDRLGDAIETTARSL